MNKVKWFFGVWWVGIGIFTGRHNYESSENELKLLAQKYRVNWHKFRE